LDLSTVEIRLGLPWYIRLGAPIRASAFTGTESCIYCLPERYAPDSVAGLALLAHELTHCVQYQRHGWWGLRTRYVLAYFRALPRTRSFAGAYFAVPFEQEARGREAQVRRALEK